MLEECIASQSEVIAGHRVGLQSMLWGARTSGFAACIFASAAAAAAAAASAAAAVAAAALSAAAAAAARHAVKKVKERR